MLLLVYANVSQSFELMNVAYVLMVFTGTMLELRLIVGSWPSSPSPPVVTSLEA